MRVPILIIGAVAVCIASAVSAQTACEAETHLTYNQAVELEGTLKAGKGEHEAQGPFS